MMGSSKKGSSMKTKSRGKFKMQAMNMGGMSMKRKKMK